MILVNCASLAKTTCNLVSRRKMCKGAKRESDCKVHTVLVGEPVVDLAHALAVQRVLVCDRVAHEVRHVREPHDLDRRREAQAHLLRVGNECKLKLKLIN